MIKYISFHKIEKIDEKLGYTCTIIVKTMGVMATSIIRRKCTEDLSANE